MRQECIDPKKGASAFIKSDEEEAMLHLKSCLKVKGSSLLVSRNLFEKSESSNNFKQLTEYYTDVKIDVHTCTCEMRISSALFNAFFMFVFATMEVNSSAPRKSPRSLKCKRLFGIMKLRLRLG